MFKALLLSLALANSADATTSVLAFRRGATEMNPFVLSTRTTPFLTQVSVATAGELWFATQVNKRHPKLAKALLIVSIGAGTAASIHNVHVYRSLAPTSARR
jgi:hypothetical protein